MAFKRLKSILRLDRLPAKDPGLARAWIAAHLLLALLIEDTTAQMADFSPSEFRNARARLHARPEPSACPRALATHLPPGGCPESHHLAGRDACPNRGNVRPFMSTAVRTTKATIIATSS